MSARIALLSPYALSVPGGVQEQVLAMSRELCAREAAVLVIAPDDGDSAVYDTPASVVHLGRRRLVSANGSRAPVTVSLVASRRARSALEAFEPDVVHFHEPFAPVLGWSALWAHEVPAVGTFHRGGYGPALSLTRPLLRRFASRLDVAASVSDEAAITLERSCGLKSRVLFNGIEPERFVATARERGDTPVLFYVGRLEARKGVATAIAATLAHNARVGERWRLVVAGDGPERTRLEQLAQGSPSVEFLGRVSDEEKRRWLRRADVLIAPSTFGESFGLVLLEAMASETRVVASDIDGYRHAAGDFATLFRAGDPAELEAAISRALEGEGDERITAARRYAERWSITQLVDRYEELYAEATSRFRDTR